MNDGQLSIAKVSKNKIRIKEQIYHSYIINYRYTWK